MADVLYELEARLRRDEEETEAVIAMELAEMLEQRLRQELRWLVETKLWLERQGVAAERPDAIWELEREIARVRLALYEIEKAKQEEG